MALSHFKPELYDLVLIDIKMPRWMALTVQTDKETRS